MTWEILTGLLTLAGALGGFAKTIMNNTRAMTELRCTVAALHEASKEQRGELNALRTDFMALTERVGLLELDIRSQNTYRKEG